jgi:hypothetical protein
MAWLLAVRISKLQPTSPRVIRIEAADAVDGIVPDALNAGGRQAREQGNDVACRESNVRFLRRSKIFLDSNVKLARTYLEPAPAARAQSLRFDNFVHAQPLTKESACL